MVEGALHNCIWWSFVIHKITQLVWCNVLCKLPTPTHYFVSDVLLICCGSCICWCKSMEVLFTQEWL